MTTILNMADPTQRAKGIEILQRWPDYTYIVNPTIGDWVLRFSGYRVEMGKCVYSNLKLYQMGIPEAYLNN